MAGVTWIALWTLLAVVLAITTYLYAQYRVKERFEAPTSAAAMLKPSIMNEYQREFCDMPYHRRLFKFKPSQDDWGQWSDGTSRCYLVDDDGERDPLLENTPCEQLKNSAYPIIAGAKRIKTKDVDESVPSWKCVLEIDETQDSSSFITHVLEDPNAVTQATTISELKVQVRELQEQLAACRSNAEGCVRPDPNDADCPLRLAGCLKDLESANYKIIDLGNVSSTSTAQATYDFLNCRGELRVLTSSNQDLLSCCSDRDTFSNMYVGKVIAERNLTKLLAACKSGQFPLTTGGTVDEQLADWMSHIKIGDDGQACIV